MSNEELKKKLSSLCFLEFELGRRFEAGMPMYSWDAFKQDNEQEFTKKQTLINEILGMCDANSED
ncbi:hypothetical protein [Anabaena sp. CCY 9910]|uniref:hypothetical protein n=1 Tax=Anabaena sp. CCY 9910 TaxID=3103870 RepID=UPI0039E1DEAE